MSDYLTEQEQVDLLKNWLKQYLPFVFAGLLISIVIIYGYRYWQTKQENILVQASVSYDEMLSQSAHNESPQDKAQKIFKQYPHTVYAELAAFTLAKDAASKMNFAYAKEKLDWVLKNSKTDSFKQIARLRLAKILINENKAQDAIKILTTVDDKNFSGMVNEVTGDAYLALKDSAKAKTFYQQALVNLPNAQIVRPILQMKYDDLA